MEYHQGSVQFPPGIRIESEGLRVVCGFWLHVGFVGASLMFAALLALVDGAARPLFTLAAALAGGGLAAFAWRRARVALDRAGGVAAAAAPAATLGHGTTLAT